MRLITFDADHRLSQGHGVVWEVVAILDGGDRVVPVIPESAYADRVEDDDIAAHVRLKHRAGDALTLALGNFAFSRWDCKALLDEGVVSILQPDVAWAGGITETLRIVALAHDAGVPVILHNGAEQPWAVEMSCALDCITELECVDRDGGGFAGGLFETVEAENGMQRQVLWRSVLQRLR